MHQQTAQKSTEALEVFVVKLHHVIAGTRVMVEVQLSRRGHAVVEAVAPYCHADDDRQHRECVEECR